MITSSANELAKNIAKQTENLVLEQLNEFVKRGLIMIETSSPVLVWNLDPSDPNAKLEMRRTVKLVLKDQEYIEQLERENKALKDAHSKIQEWASLTFQKEK